MSAAATSAQPKQSDSRGKGNFFCSIATVESAVALLACVARLQSRAHRRARETERNGWVAEWFKAAVLKTAVRVTVPWVRIPPHPP